MIVSYWVLSDKEHMFAKCGGNTEAFISEVWREY